MTAQRKPGDELNPVLHRVMLDADRQGRCGLDYAKARNAARTATAESGFDYLDRFDVRGSWQGVELLGAGCAQVPPTRTCETSGGHLGSGARIMTMLHLCIFSSDF